MDYLNFNQHKVLPTNDKLLILNVMDSVLKNEYTWMILQNELFGLFDGCYYIGLEQRVFDSEHLDEENKLTLLRVLINC